MKGLKNKLIEFDKLLSKHTGSNINKDFVKYISSLKEKEIKSAIETTKKIHNSFEKLVSDNNGGSKRRKKTRRRRTKKRGGGEGEEGDFGGMLTIGLGLGMLPILYLILKLMFGDDRYRGQVPRNFRNMSAYPHDFPYNYSGSSNPHRRLYPGQYQRQREVEDHINEYYDNPIHDTSGEYEELVSAAQQEAEPRRRLMQSGIRGFQESLENRRERERRFYEPGGVGEYVAGIWGRNRIMREAQSNPDVE